MNKKEVIIAILLGVVLVGIVGAAFFMEANNTTILEINGVKYDKSDFESYLKVWQYEAGNEPIDIDTMYSNYQAYKLYSQYVDKYHIELSSGEKIATLSSGDIETLRTKYDLAEEDYMNIKTEIAEVDKLFENLPDYWKVSDEEYEEHKTAYGAENFKMYNYRQMQISVEQPSGELASGETSGERLQALEDKAMSRAVEALEKVKSGDDFKKVAEEYGTMRITYSADGYQIVNGDLESVAGIYLTDFIYDENVLKALTTLKAGEYSEIFSGDGYYSFVYLESITDGLTGGSDLFYKRQIAGEHIQGEAIFVPSKITLKSVKLEELIPIYMELLNGENSVEEEHNHDHEEEETENISTSGETISGDK